MKKILLTLASLMVITTVQASVISDGDGFRIGKLDNGLTYYLYHNEVPKGCADFFIAHNVGALQEDDSQNGLAHFLEHMAFNGTAHYPDKGLLEFLAKEGVRFGYNVNAYTSRSETVYNISKVPLARESFVDSVLLVLRDWSCDISCEQEAIDAERGVIHEEWRRRDGQRYRMANKQTAILYKGSKQPERTVLGEMDIILNFKREDILDFYHRWYRPDMQAIIVVGDYDLNDMEARIRKTFSDIPAAVNPEQKGNYFPAEIPGPRFEDMTDSQLRYHAFKLFCKQPYPQDRSTMEFQKDLFARQIITSIVGEHMDRRCQEKDSKVKSAVLVLGDEGPCFYLSQFTLAPKQKEEMIECMRMACSEIERINRHGISRQEFDHAKFNVRKKARLTQADASPAPENTDIAKSCIESFLRGYPCLTPEEMRNVRREILDNLTYEDVLPYASSMFDLESAIFSNSYIDSDAELMPTETQMRAVLESVKSSSIEPGFIEYEDAMLDVNPAAGRIVKESSPKGTDYKCWKLSNGAKVWWCKSEPIKAGMHTIVEFKYDTGLNAFPDDEVASVKFATAVTSKYCGISGNDRQAIANTPEMEGLNVFTSAVRSRYATFYVSASENKEEDAFRYAHLWLTDPYPCQEINLTRAKSDILQSLAKERTSSDMFADFKDSLRFGDHPWLAGRDSASIERVDMDYLDDVLLKLFGDPEKAEVFICSDKDEAQIRSLVEKYISSIPQRYKSEAKPRNKMLKPTYKGVQDIEKVGKKRTSPFTEVEYAWLAKVKDDQRMMATCDILDHVMSARYLARIREERGGTYHVSFNSDLYRDGKKSELESIVSFRTRAELKEILISDVRELMDAMCESGPTSEEVETAVKYLVKYKGEKKQRIARSVQLQNEKMIGFVRHSDKDVDYATLVRSITPGEVQKLARKINSGERLLTVYEEK